MSLSGALLPGDQVYLKAHSTLRDDMREWRSALQALYEATPLAARMLLAMAASEPSLRFFADALGPAAELRPLAQHFLENYISRNMEVPPWSAVQIPACQRQFWALCCFPSRRSRPRPRPSCGRWRSTFARTTYPASRRCCPGLQFKSLRFSATFFGHLLFPESLTPSAPQQLAQHFLENYISRNMEVASWWPHAVSVLCVTLKPLFHIEVEGRF